MKGYVLIGHGPLPMAFKESVQMIAGEMSNLYGISLLPEEGVDQLTAKIEKLKFELESYDEVIFFADLLGGTPANTAFKLFSSNQRVTVLTGMNFPMVLTALLGPDESHEAIITAGQAGIKDLKAPEEKVIPARKQEKTMEQEKTGEPRKIKNVRIDARGIHGQVATAWVPHLKVNRIIVIDDQTIKDPTQKKALKMAKPNNVKLSILSTETAVARLMDPTSYQDESVLILLQKVSTLEKLNSIGYHFEEITMGNVPSREGTKKYRNTVHLTPKEVSIIEQELANGVKFSAQMVPNDGQVDFSEILKKSI